MILIRQHWLAVTQILFGLALLYIAIFLHEDEEGILRNRIIDLWNRINTTGEKAHSGISRFSQALSSLLVRSFDWYFGKELFSPRVIGTSILLSAASGFLTLAIFELFRFKDQGHLLKSTVSTFIRFFVWASIPAIYPKRWLVFIWWMSIIAFPLSGLGFFIFLAQRQGTSYVFHGIGYSAFAFLFSFSCDVIYIAITRKTLRKLTGPIGFGKSLYLISCNMLLLLLFIVLPIWVGLKLTVHSVGIGVALMASSASNSLNICVTLVALLSSALLFVHNAFWRLIERPLYALIRFDPIQNHRGKLLVIGSSLIFAPLTSLSQILHMIVSKL